MPQTGPTRWVPSANVFLGIVGWSCSRLELVFPFEPKGREFESLRAHHFRGYPLPPYLFCVKSLDRATCVTGMCVES